MAELMLGHGADRHGGPVDALCAWIDRHLTDFQALPVAVDGVVPLERVKCSGELLLVLFALTAPRMGSVPGLQLWARRVGRSLGPCMARLGDDVDWDRLSERIVGESCNGRFLMVYPLLAAVTGQRSLFHDHALTALRAASRRGGVRALDMDVRFALQLSGVRTVRSTMRAEVVASLHACSARPDAAVSSTEYSLTHAIFYLTEFGRRSPGLPGPVARRLSSYLVDTAAARVREEHLDIAAELLFCQACLGRHLDDVWHEELQLLATRAAPSHRAAPGVEASPSGAALGEFERDYHLILVVLLAVASGMAVSRGRRTVT